MKTVLITCAVLCLFGLAAHHVAAQEDGSEDAPITDEQAQCILDVLVNTDLDVEHVGDMALDVVETFSRLIQHFMRCEAILSDPPTALEERRHEACRLTWYASVVAELLRLRNQSQAVEFFDDLLEQIYACREL